MNDGLIKNPLFCSFLANSKKTWIAFLQITYNQQYVNCLLLASGSLDQNYIISTLRLNLMNQAAPAAHDSSQPCTFIHEDRKYILSFKNYQIQQFNQSSASWFQHVHLCALFFDVSSKAQFSSIANLLGKLTKNLFNLAPIRFILVGLRQNNQPKEVSLHEGKQVIKDIGFYIQIEDFASVDFAQICKLLQQAKPYYYGSYYLSHKEQILAASPSKVTKIHQQNHNYAKILNSAIVGSVETGKSAFCLQLADNKTSNTHEQASKIGVDCKFHFLVGTKRLPSTPLGNFRRTKIQLKSDLFFIFYDLTNKESFEKVGYYYQRFMKTGLKAYKQFVLVATKADLQQKHEITQKEGEMMAQELGMLFLSISNLSKDDVEDCFLKAIEYYFFCMPKQQQS